MILGNLFQRVRLTKYMQNAVELLKIFLANTQVARWQNYLSWKINQLKNTDQPRK